MTVIFQVLPRGMRYSLDGATSIDLCVSEITGASRHGATTDIIAEAGKERLPGGELNRFAVGMSSGDRIAHVVHAARARRPEAIIVQQHVPSAGRIARRVPDTPVILHLHNLPKSPASRVPGVATLKHAFKVRLYRRVAGLIFVSDVAQAQFEAIFPTILAPRTVVPNGFDPTAFPISAARAPEILCVGRVAPEKGIREAARGIALALAARPDWRATLLLSQREVHADYAAAVERDLAPLRPRISLTYDVRHDAVRAACSRAAIALVPSLWAEPFGRTAIEAHAGGAALVSSGTGGLRAISGPSADYLPEVTPSAIARALVALIDDEPRRLALARAGHARVLDAFAIRSVASRFDDFVEAVIQSWHGRRGKAPEP